MKLVLVQLCVSGHAEGWGATKNTRASIKQPLLAVCLAAGAFAFAGCSYTEQLFILGRSAKPLVVIATADVWAHAETGARVCAWSAGGQTPLPLRATTAERLGRIACSGARWLTWATQRSMKEDVRSKQRSSRLRPFSFNRAA
jgi:hypothetical protein